MSTTTKARKGDLILVETVSRNYYSHAAYEEAKAAGRTLPTTTTKYEFGVVDSATREGFVKTWRAVGYGDALTSDGYTQKIVTYPIERWWVMTAKTIDVEGVLRAAKAHHWPGHPGQPKAFDTLDEAKQVAKPFLLVAVRS